MEKDVYIYISIFLIGIVGFFLRDAWSNRKQYDLIKTLTSLDKAVALLTQEIEGLGEKYASVISHNDLALKIALIEEQIKILRGKNEIV